MSKNNKHVQYFKDGFSCLDHEGQNAQTGADHGGRLDIRKRPAKLSLPSGDLVRISGIIWHPTRAYRKACAPTHGLDDGLEVECGVGAGALELQIGNGRTHSIFAPCHGTTANISWARAWAGKIWRMKQLAALQVREPKPKPQPKPQPDHEKQKQKTRNKACSSSSSSGSSSINGSSSSSSSSSSSGSSSSSSTTSTNNSSTSSTSTSSSQHVEKQVQLQHKRAHDEARFDGSMDIWAAAKTGHAETIKSLLSAFNAAGDRSSFAALDAWGNSALYYACHRGHVQVVSLLVREYAAATTTSNSPNMQPY